MCMLLLFISYSIFVVSFVRVMCGAQLVCMHLFFMCKTIYDTSVLRLVAGVQALSAYIFFVHGGSNHLGISRVERCVLCAFMLRFML